jgi:hypothetical protein
MHVAVHTERGETADLLRRGIGALLAELRDSGFSSTSFAFEGQDGRQAPANSARDGAPGVEDDTPQASPLPNGTTAAGRLDLRL